MSNVHIIIKNYIFYIINIIMVKIKMVLSFLGPKGVLFYEIMGGHSMPPPPPVIGLMQTEKSRNLRRK